MLASKGAQAASETPKLGAASATPAANPGPATRLLLEGGYQQLCRQLPASFLAPSLQQLLELVFEVLASYQLMSQFHEANQQTASQREPEGQEADGSSGGEGDQMVQVQEATRKLLQAVAAALRTGRGEVADAAGAKVKELLMVPEMAKGDEVMQVGGG